MKLYLSSFRLGDHPEQLAQLIGSNKNIAVIPNALDFSNDQDRREMSMQKEYDALHDLGLQSEEIDLRNYFNKSEDLAQKLSEFGALWVRGGNVFVLRRAFKESGLDEWLKGQRSNPELVYGGYSAGVCVLSPSLKGTDLVDDPNIVPEGYPQEVIWEGVGLIDFAFAPHFESPGHPETEAVNKVVEYYRENGVEYKALHDGEVIILNTESVK